MGGFVTSVGTLAFCYSTNYLSFIIARVAQGIGCGFVNAASSALCAALFEDADLAYVFALFEAVLGTAYALGPAVGSVLYGVGGFQVPFLISVRMFRLFDSIYPPQY